jgi:hypothetical protein
MLFRRQQRIKKQLKQLREQLTKLSVVTQQIPPLQESFEKLKHQLEPQLGKIPLLQKNFERLKTLLGSHTHKEYITKKQLPKPYVHPKKGVCPQKPQVHKHLTKEIVDLKIPKPYDFEQLKRDHPKLKEPYLHKPKKHKHPAEDIISKIKPEQIQRKGLDADTVDGKHAKDLVKRLITGGAGAHARLHETGGADKVYFAALEHTSEDPTTHDNLTSTPHISQAEKDQIHPKEHTHDGVDVSKVDHTLLSNVQPDQHHSKLHASSHLKDGDDVLGHVIALKFGAEGAATTSLDYVTIADSDIAINPALFNVTGQLFAKFIYHIKNDTAGETTYIQVYRQNAGTLVTGSEKSIVGAGWGIVETDWIDFSTESGSESYQLQMKVTGGVGEFNSAIMILSPVQL